MFKLGQKIRVIGSEEWRGVFFPGDLWIPLIGKVGVVTKPVFDYDMVSVCIDEELWHFYPTSIVPLEKNMQLEFNFMYN